MSLILTHGANSLVRTPQLPGNCILLDYFIDGYRFGTSPTGDAPTSIKTILDTDTYNLSYFNNNIFPNGFPAAEFNGTSSNSTLKYTIDNYTSEEFTIECLIRYDVGDQNYRSSYRIYYGDANTDFGYFRVDRCGWYGDSYAYARNNKSGTYQWDGSYTNPAKFIDGSRNWIGWHHVAISLLEETVYIFIDGTLCKTADAIACKLVPSLTPPLHLRIEFSPYSYDTNGGNKAGLYQIAQFAVWDKARYTESFNVSKDLILNQT